MFGSDDSFARNQLLFVRHIYIVGAMMLNFCSCYCKTGVTESTSVTHIKYPNSHVPALAYI